MLFKRKKKVTEEKKVFVNQPKGTEDIVDIRNIIIPPTFAQTEPQSWKMSRCQKRYHQSGHLDSPISVIPETNEDGKSTKLLLVDGYTRYLLARYIKLKEIPIKYIDINTYNIKQ